MGLLSTRPGVRCFVAALLIGLAICSLADAGSLTVQKTQIRRAGSYLRSIDRMLRADRKEDAAEALSKAQDVLTEVAKQPVDPKLKRLFRATTELLAEKHALLKGAGIEVVELENLNAVSDDGRLGAGSRQDSKGRFDANQVSFVRDVAPMLSSKCGSCHINGSRGGFSLASYRDLMRGSREGGRVIVPGDGATSLITELIQSGDMPRGGGRVTPQELNKLVMWITQGAKFDGTDETTNLRELKPSGTPAREKKPEPEMKGPKFAKPTGKETVSFALDVAPILSSKCSECHGGNNPDSGLSFMNFARLLKGGDGGEIVHGGKPETSSLVRRITGEDMPRMPQNRPPLSNEEIETIRTWVREGATFDGPDASLTLPRVTSLVQAERATPEELNAMRVESARRMWKLATPDEAPASTETEHYYLLGNLPEARLHEIGVEAERLTKDLFKLFGHPKGKPLAKGRVTILVFAQRIDYSEFGLMVRKQQTPKGERGNSGYDIVDAYAAVQMSVDTEPGDTRVLAQQLAAVYLGERTSGRLPDWLIEGLSRAAAARAAPKDQMVEQWKEGIASAARSISKPKDLLTGKLPPAKAKILLYGFAEGFLRREGKLHKVINDVAAGKPFDVALEQAYGYDSVGLATAWLRSVSRGR